MIKEDCSKFQHVALENSKREVSLLNCVQHCLSPEDGEV